MIQTPMDVLKNFPIRKSKKQKTAFREAAQKYFEYQGYEYREEKGSLGARNVVIGDPESAKYLITAHYDTPAGMPFPNFITPCNFLAYLAYQIVITCVMFAPSIALHILLDYFYPYSPLSFLIPYCLLWATIIFMMVGPANKSNANDNTSGVVTVLEIARTLPENQRSKVCFVLFDLEEAGLLGSSSYRSSHKKATNNQMVLNLDCVGDGNEIVFFPTGKVRKDRKKMEQLCKCVGRFGPKTIAIRDKGFSFYPSDQANFPYGVGIAALRRNKLVGLYMDKIHTKKDTILEETNVNILRAALTTYMSSDTAE